MERTPSQTMLPTQKNTQGRVRAIYVYMVGSSRYLVKGLNSMRKGSPKIQFVFDSEVSAETIELWRRKLSRLLLENELLILTKPQTKDEMTIIELVREEPFRC